MEATDTIHREAGAWTSPELTAARVLWRAGLGGLAILVFGFLWSMALHPRMESVASRVLLATVGTCGAVWYGVQGFGPLFRFLAGGLENRTASRARWRCSRLFVLLVTALVLDVAATFVRCGIEQMSCQPQDSARFRIEDWECAPRGLLLTMKSGTQVQEVWRHTNILQPWRAQHEAVEFRVRHLADGQEQLLVEYPFTAGGEWSLALRSRDGYWDSGSGYSPSVPTVGDKVWDLLWSSAERRGPR